MLRVDRTIAGSNASAEASNISLTKRSVDVSANSSNKQDSGVLKRAPFLKDLKKRERRVLSFSFNRQICLLLQNNIFFNCPIIDKNPVTVGEHPNHGEQAILILRLLSLFATYCMHICCQIKDYKQFTFKTPSRSITFRIASSSEWLWFIYFEWTILKLFISKSH